jgi:hypothetical protein
VQEQLRRYPSMKELFDLALSSGVYNLDALPVAFRTTRGRATKDGIALSAKETANQFKGVWHDTGGDRASYELQLRQRQALHQQFKHYCNKDGIVSTAGVTMPAANFTSWG